MARPRNIRLSTGFKVPLDGDLLAIVEALYKEVTLRNVLNPSFETMRSEILALIGQMNAAELRAYFAESLFLNSVTYENELLSAYVRKLGTKPVVPRRSQKPERTSTKGRARRA